MTGNRRAREFVPKPRLDKFAEGVIMAIEMSRHKGMLLRDNVPGVPDDDQSYLVIFDGKRINLSEMTMSELAAVRLFWETAINEAAEHVVRLDNEAAESLATTGRPSPRMYRPEPVIADFRPKEDS